MKFRVAILAAVVCFPFRGWMAPSFVHVDPRIELMTVVQLLSGYSTMSRLDSSYKRDVTNYFGPHKNHRAVRLYAEMSRDHFAYDAVPRALLAYSDPPTLKPLGVPDKKTLRRAGGQRKLNDFIQALREFADAAQFAEFVKAHQEDYLLVESSLREDVEAAVRALRGYTGLQFTNCELIAGMLVHNGGFQATIAGLPDGPRSYAIIGAFGLSNGLPVFSSNGSVSYVAQHEFSHSFVNPFVETHSKEFNRHSSLFKPIKKQMQQLSYADWQTAVHEHIVRAIVVRMAYVRSHAAGARILHNEEQQGFRYVKPLAEKLQEYEEQREKYPTILAFLPQLIGVFENLDK